MMRRWAGVYSSSAFGNWARSITNLGVITILPRWNAKFTRSPLDSPAWRRTLVGIVTWPLCWIFAVVFIEIRSDQFRKSGIRTSACSITKRGPLGAVVTLEAAEREAIRRAGGKAGGVAVIGGGITPPSQRHNPKSG